MGYLVDELDALKAKLILPDGGNETLYVVQVADLEYVYDERHRAGAFAALSPRQQDRLIHSAKKALDGWMLGYDEALEIAIDNTA
jgi:hypothetical protein|tara:strand:+ start:395 stop:649 length:255 start_codon:yes stop_codon:yes gene_type:complete